MLYPPLYVSIRMLGESNFAVKAVLNRAGAIYIGEGARYTVMHCISDLAVEVSEQCYTVSRCGKRVFEVSHSPEAAQLITTIIN